MTYQKVKLIERTPLGLHGKVETFLIYANQKPATVLLIGDRKNYDLETNVYKLSEERVRKAKNLLRKLQLPHAITEPMVFEVMPKQEHCPLGLYIERVSMYVGQTQELCDRLIQAVQDRDSYALGRLFGFPETAIQAYHGERSPFMGELNDRTVLGAFFTQFVFSQEYFDEEFQNCSVRWHDTVKRLSPKIYKQLKDEYENNSIPKRETGWR